MPTGKFLPFVTPLWASVVELNSSIESKCLDFVQNNPSVSISNRGGYQSKTILPDGFKDIFPEVIDAIMPCVQDVANDLGSNLSLSSAWINVNNKGDFNVPHVHTECAFSAILYVKTPEDCGKLIFKNPTESRAYPIKGNTFGFVPTWEVTPSEGLVYVFPSYLEHYVEPSKADSSRISIAFNFIQI